MDVVIDANVICSDFSFNGRWMSELKEVCKQGDLRLHIPQVSVDEAMTVFEKGVIALQQDIEKLSRKSNRLAIDLRMDQLDGEGVKSTVANQRIKLENTFRNMGANIIPYDVLPGHTVFVKRVLQNRRPFVKDDEGYRDALVWECVVHVASNTDEPIALVSGDSRAFAIIDSGQVKLHPNLIWDLQQIGVDSERITLCLSLKELFESHPTISDIDAMEFIVTHTDNGQYLFYQLTNVAPYHYGLDDAIDRSDREWNPQDYGLSAELNIIEVEAHFGNASWVLVDASWLPSGDALVRMSGIVPTTLSHEVFWGSGLSRFIEKYEGIRPIEDWDDDPYAADEEVKLKVEIEVVVNRSSLYIDELSVLDFGPVH